VEVQAPQQPIEQTLPWEVGAALQACPKGRSLQLQKHSYNIAFEIQTTDEGVIQEVKATGDRLDNAEVEECMLQALKATSVRDYLRLKEPSESQPQSVAPNSRALLGTTALLPQAIRLAPIVIAAPGGVTIVVSVVIIVAVAAVVADMSEECLEEWRNAYKYCQEQLESNDPPRGVTGGYVNTKDCARGRVREACGGNLIDWGGKGARPGRRT
jgi:hypothetical protein